MRHYLYSFTLLGLLLSAGSAMAADAATPSSAVSSAETLQQAFNDRYSQYFGASSQSLLPFPAVEKAAWQQLQQSRPLRKIYSEPGKYYNAKVYTFTLYRAEDDGSYYLDVAGGFWGMDELIYGPLSEQELR